MMLVIIMAAALLITSAVPVAFAAPGTDASGKFTVWKAFFMLLTVIPFSKMFLSVLVKMIAPNKTEGGFMTMATGGLAAVAMTARAVQGRGGSGGSPLGATRQSAPNPPNTTKQNAPGPTSTTGPSAPNTTGPSTTGPSTTGPSTPNTTGLSTPSSPNTTGQNVPSTPNATRQNAPGTPGAPGQNAPGQGSSPGTPGAPGQGGISGTQGVPGKGGAPGTQGAPRQGGAPGTQSAPGKGTPGTQGATGKGAKGNTGPAPIGQRTLGDILNTSGQAGNKAARSAAMYGAASAFAAPSVAPLASAAGGLIGKTAGSFAAATYNTALELKTRKNNGDSFWDSMQGMTGTNNRVAATAKVAAALTLSPLGGAVARTGANAIGGMANTGGNAAGTPSGVGNKVVNKMSDMWWGR